MAAPEAETTLAIVVRTKWVWRLRLPVGTAAIAVVAPWAPSAGVPLVVAGLLMTYVVWAGRLEVDEERMTVTHHRPPLPTRQVRIDRVNLMKVGHSRWDRDWVQLRLQDDQGGRISIRVSFWRAWRGLARAVASNASDELVLDGRTARHLRLQSRRVEPDVWVPPDPEA